MNLICMEIVVITKIPVITVLAVIESLFFKRDQALHLYIESPKLSSSTKRDEKQKRLLENTEKITPSKLHRLLPWLLIEKDFDHP